MRVSALLPLLFVMACSAEKAPAPLETRSAATTGAQAPVPADAPVILAFGDSLYAGYQLDPGQGYPARLEAALNAAGVKARVVNAGVSGDTTAAARQRLAFTLDNQPVKPALVMVGLGGNDMLRGLPPEETLANLDAILAELKRRGIPAMLTGMLAAPNLGADYGRAFNPIWPTLAKKYDAALPASTSSRASTSMSCPAKPWRCWGHPARASRRCSPCSPASNARVADRCRWRGRISPRSTRTVLPPRGAGGSASCSRPSTCCRR